MEKVTLKAEPRQVGRHSNRELRNAQQVPAVIYGQDTEAVAVAIDRKALGIALHAAGGRPIELELAGHADLHVLAREVQRHPVKHNVQHVDFMAVSMTKRVRLEVPVVNAGHAPVMSNQDMVLVRLLDSVEIECLPGDIPEHLTADLSKLATVDDEVLVKDLIAPAGVKVLTDGDIVVLSVTMSRAGLEEEAADQPSADAVEVVSKRKPKDEMAASDK